MADHRTWGQTKNCRGCRFWSETLARSCGGQVEAMCISPQGVHRGRYTTGNMYCQNWTAGPQGAIDDPDGNPYEGER